MSGQNAGGGSALNHPEKVEDSCRTEHFKSERFLGSGTDMRRISAVTFDLWDTLIKELPGGSEKVAKLRIEGIGTVLNERGIAHSPGEIESAYLETGEFLALTWSKKRDMSVRDQILFLLSSVDAKLASRLSARDLADVERIYSESIFEHPPRLLPGAKHALEGVKNAGYKVGLISNTGRTPGSTLRGVMDKMNILDYFDTTTFSNEIQVRKPAEKAFTITLDKLKVVPRAAVHIGDDAEKDIAGAKQCGMRAIQIVAGDERPSEIADARRSSLSQILDEIDRL